MANHVLAIDLGSTGIKTAVIDGLGRVCAGAGEVLPMIVTDDGGVEQDPKVWWEAIGRCARRSIASSGVAAADVTLVAVTSQYTSTIAVAEDGMPLSNAIMWMDQRGRAFNPASGNKHARARWLEVHGLVPSGNDDIGHVSYIRAALPEVYAAAHAFVEPMDYVAARLTGVVTATQNTMFPMLSVDNRAWGSTHYCDELLEMSQFDVDKLPRLVPLGSPRGSILTHSATHLGVSSSATVAGATIDSITSAIGTGAIDHTSCGLIIGTTSVMATHLPSKRFDVTHGLTSAPSPLPGAHLLIAENGIGGKALDVFVNNIVFADDGLGTAAPPDAFERVVSAAEQVPPGSNGVMFLPWLVGSGAPGHQRRVRGGFVNIGLSTTRADMARAVLEGVALNAAWLMPHFTALAGCTYDEVTIGGGGAESAVWGQIFADCLGVSVRRLSNPSNTNAHGAALLALAETGHVQYEELPGLLVTAQVHDPRPQTQHLIEHLRRSFIDFHDRATPFYNALNSPEAPA